MVTKKQRFRALASQLARLGAERLVILTGARQTGKTTMARKIFGQLRYLNLDDIDVRETLRSVRASQWGGDVGPAILDEAQKEPGVFDKVKYAYDAGEIRQTLLLGSSQILLLRRVRETLAGRAFVFELWPLMASEIARAEDEAPPNPLLHRLLTSEGTVERELSRLPSVLIGTEADAGLAAVQHLATWGGMPELLRLDDEARAKWLQSYDATYLERDLADVGSLPDLLTFRRFQRLAALRSGQLLVYADLARDALISVSTAKRYLEFIGLTYQAFLLPPYATNLTSAIIKSPKLYWLDLGLWRQLSGYRGDVTGQLMETLVVGEVYKWVKTNSLPIDLTFYRTRSGLEIDLLATTPNGVLGIEVKAGRRLSSGDWRALRDVGEALGPRWLGGLVVYQGAKLEPLADKIWAVPVDRLLVG